ncbi:phosphodiesterase, MJ0936 family [Calditerrivibrio nitroreducens DSM 19672]|uniref:Phosphoesterase n=2 Tax=Calditerrivibrio nitroreducens TaxID=477976 RepID=E4TEE8_CALNY|nr:phosphodiesterase, MJ0936 family [Calditerrivibrio nitroreducens DSM 19672]
MLVAIISDTHDNLEKLTKAIDMINSQNVDYCFHLGDICSPFAAKLLNTLKMPYAGVFGNNDGEWIGIKRITNNRFFKPPHYMKVSEYSFVLLHEGDIAEYIDKSIDFVFFGHTHEPYVKTKDNQLIVNPGTLSGYVSGKATFALIDTETKQCKIVEI